jgi:methyl-accepting chemotaxis protein
MKPRMQIQKTALAITRWIGSPASIIVHTIAFIAGFVAIWVGLVEWNQMLLFVTTLVSLEAIYLSIFIQLSINYTTEAVADISEDVEEIQEDIGEIQEDVEDISEDVEEMSEEEAEDEADDAAQKKTLADIQSDLRKLMSDIEKLQQKQ